MNADDVTEIRGHKIRTDPAFRSFVLVLCKGQSTENLFVSNDFLKKGGKKVNGFESYLKGLEKLFS